MREDRGVGVNCECLFHHRDVTKAKVRKVKSLEFSTGNEASLGREKRMKEEGKLKK